LDLFDREAELAASRAPLRPPREKSYDARKRSRHSAARAAQTRSTVPAKALNSTGLTRKASNPAAVEDPRRSSKALAV
jgi:hypothetical protein